MKQRTLRKAASGLTWEDTYAILSKQQEGVLAINGLDGYPYAVPMNYVLNENKLIMHSAAEGYKLDCLANNSKVSFTAYNVFEVKETTSNWESAMVFGSATVVNDNTQKEQYMRTLAGKFGPNPPASLPPDLLNRITIIVLDIEEFSGKLKK